MGREKNRSEELDKGLFGHGLKVVLVEPEIPQNAGNIGRLCAAAGAELHLVRPLGFFLSDRHFKRAGMDYLKDVRMEVHDDVAALLKRIAGERVVLTSGVRGQSHWSMRYEKGCWLMFGKESAGLSQALLEVYAEWIVQIPMQKGARGLNLSTAAGIVLYEAVRQIAAGG